MTYLQLLAKLCKKIGYPEPSSVQDNDRDVALAAQWISDAWLEVQDECPRFDFMTVDSDLNILIDKSDYTKTELSLPTLRSWEEDKMYLFDGTEYVRELEVVTYAVMKDLQYKTPLTDEPQYFTQPHGTSAIKLYPTPKQAYTIKSTRVDNPVVLTDDTDVPSCPDYFHDIIYYKALEFYSIEDNSPEDNQHGLSQYEKFLNRLDRQHCPQPDIESRSEVKCPSYGVF